MKMAQEEQKHSNSSSGGGSGGAAAAGGGCSGGRSQKKMKQKKVPQRGLGVAQLEKIRMEEQHKKGVHVVSANHQITISPSSNNNSSSSCFIRPSSVVMTSSSNSAPVLDLPAIPNLDFLNSNPLSLPKQFNGFGFRQPNNGMNLPFLPLPNELQRSQQPCSSSTVNISSSPSSSILNFQMMEPPSNQNTCPPSSYTPLWPDEEKMVGMKRPYPFAVETPPAPSFHFKFSPCCVGSSSAPRLDEPASCSNSCTLNNDPPAFSAIREGHSRSSTMSETNHKAPSHTENGMLSGDFLTLAPPASPHLSSKFSSTDSVPEFGFQPTPFISEDVTPAGQEPAFFSFFPAAKKEIGPVTSSTYIRHGEVAEKVDLSLKL